MLTVNFLIIDVFIRYTMKTKITFCVYTVKGAGTEGNRPGSPVPIPAPRRKRKMKREDTLRGSLRARKKGSTTILDELEEKVRELEESTSRKEEELRIADHETTELNSRLTAAHQLALLKVQ